MARLLLATLLLLLLPAALAAEPGPPASLLPDKLGSRLAERLPSAEASEEHRIIVKLAEGRGERLGAASLRSVLGRAARADRVRALQDDALKAPGFAGFRMRRRHTLLAGLAGRANRATIEALARHPAVERVYLDGRVQASLGQGGVLIGSGPAYGEGFRGSGVAVAVLDTGVDTDHQGLTSSLVAGACFCDDAIGPFGCCPGGGESGSGPLSAEDDDGHGTAVSGIVVADGGGGPRGVAPDADLVAVKVLSAAGVGSFSDVDSGLDWVLGNAASLGIRVVNLSFGDPSSYPSSAIFPCTGSVTADAISDLRSVGISVFVASGNEGHTDGVSFPACAADSIAVGGVYDQSFNQVGWCTDGSCDEILCTDRDVVADDLVCHTNRGPTLDLLAPNWRTRTTFPGAAGDNLYGDFGGTSAASPYAAGQAALLYAADPALGPDEVEGLLLSHGPMVLDDPDGDGIGPVYRRSDVAAALSAHLGGEDGDGDGILDDGDLSGAVGDDLCAAGASVLCDDNCPALANPDQADADGDAVGDACDLPCDNGLDDDGDGLVDFGADPGCGSVDWPTEIPACDDGLDNDSDGGIDATGTPPDPQCNDPSDVKEGSCGLGGGALVFLLGGLAARRLRL